MNKLKCLRCGHEWIPRAEWLPKACPGCKQYTWQTQIKDKEVKK